MSHHHHPPHIIGDKFPREIASGVFWLGDCMVFEGLGGKLEHSYISTYLVVGSERSLLVDTGHPKDWVAVRDQLDSLVARGIPAPSYIFPTHPELSHAGNLARLLDHFPNARACGDLRDLHLTFPKHVDKFDFKVEGDEIDLGGRKFKFIKALFRDLPATLWGYDPQKQVMFSADGMGFDHYHEQDQCGLLVEEIPDLPIAELLEVFMESSLYWTRLTNMEPLVERLRKYVVEDYPTKIIAAGHGSVVTDIPSTLPKILDGVRKNAQLAR